MSDDKQPEETPEETPEARGKRPREVTRTVKEKKRAKRS